MSPSRAFRGHRHAWVALGALVAAFSARADTNVSGSISTSTTWTLANSPYLVTGNVTVASGVTLTIQPGVTVKFNAGFILDVLGTLSAVGTSGSGITFTSSQVSPTRGYWGAVVLESGASASRLSYVTVSYGGGNGLYTTQLAIKGSSPSLDHVTSVQSSNDGLQVSVAGATPTCNTCTSSNNTGSGFLVHGGGVLSLTGAIADTNLYGVYVKAGSTVNINGATLTNNSGWALGAEHDTSLTGLTTVTMSGNGAGARNAIDYRGGTITGNERWAAGVDRIVNASTTVASTGVLTIDPGVTAKFSAWNFNLRIYGKLFAQGTAVSPITLTGTAASPGSWYGLRFESGANPSASLVSYLTLSYAGNVSGGVGALQVYASSPSFDHLTVTSSPHDGIQIYGAANPTIQNSQVNSNAHYGIDMWSGAALTLNNTSFTSNAWNVGLIDPTTILAGLSGLSATSNGGNSIAIRAAGLSASSTWHASAIPYVVTGTLGVGSGVTLTIDPGTTVRFTRAGFLNIGAGGTLVAAGTSASPIVFTSDAAAPAAGDYIGVVFLGGATTQSRITYTTISYAGSTGSGYPAIYVTSGNPVFDHLTIQNYVVGAIGIAGGATQPTITNCAFLGPASGVLNYSAPTVVAKFNYWNNATGPSGSGSGTGVNVSGGVVFEPWLAGPPSAPDWFSSSSVGNRTFNPSIGINQTVAFAATESGPWTVTWKNSGETVVRTLAGTGATGSATWDGKNSSSVAQPNGTYSYTIASTSSGGHVAAPVRGVSIINNALAFTLNSVAVSQAFFSPNGDGVQDTTAISANASFDSPVWTVNVLNSGSTVVRTSTGTGANVSFTWDGRNGSGVLQPNGSYRFQILATDGTANASATSSATVLDVTPPAASVTSLANGQTLSNVYQSGSAALAVVGSTSDTNFATWQVDYGVGASPTSWNALSNGTVPVTAATFTTWNTLPLTNGVYTLRLLARDKAGNATPRLVSPLTVANFQVTANLLEFNPGGGGSVVYTSAVPFQLSETLVVKNASGAIVRTLQASQSRAAGTYTDSWNGRNDSGSIVPDGAYFFVANVVAGANQLTWDLSNQYLNDYYDYADDHYPVFTSSWDPFNNKPYSFSYYFPKTGQVSIGLKRNTNPVPITTCALPDVVCLAFNRYEEAGWHTFTFAGVDANGTLHSEVNMIGVVSQRYAFAKNAVVVYGTKPGVTNLTVTPAIFGPAGGSQTVSFDLATYQSAVAGVAITFQNQASLGILRTMALPAQAAGHATALWDGRADNGMLVAAGYYTVTVTATDAIGNQVKSQILTTVEY